MAAVGRREMDLSALLILNVGAASAKFLLKRWLGEGGEIPGALVDVAKDKIKDVAAQREAQRQFETIGDKIAKQLLPLFEDEVKRNDLNFEAVTYELRRTLEGRIAADFFVDHDLDPAGGRPWRVTFATTQSDD